MGDAHAGVTWFWPDKGIDTGPILLQRSEPIRDEDTVGSLYFNRLFPLGIETMDTPQEFAWMKEEAMRMGFRHVESGPLVRSFYHAHEQAASTGLKVLA